jgi:hypothetical protein
LFSGISPLRSGKAHEFPSHDISISPVGRVSEEALHGVLANDAEELTGEIIRVSFRASIKRLHELPLLLVRQGRELGTKTFI